MFWKTLCEELRQQYLVPEKLAHHARAALNVVVIVLAAGLLNWLIGRAIRRVMRGDSRLVHERRARTLLPLARSIAGYAIFFVALVLALRALGVDYTAILAGAGVVGLAVGFGAQTLVRDFISGFFLLFEDLVGVGDWIVLGGISGSVERIGLRVTQVRSYDGTLHMIPNGELTRFGNQNRGFMRALVAVDIAHGQDVARAMAVAQDVAAKWYQENSGLAKEQPFVQGVLELGESGARIRIVCKAQAMKQWQVENELRLRLAQALQAAGVAYAVPERLVQVRPGSIPKDKTT
jgi:small conductance mechanosensitive channel